MKKKKYYIFSLDMTFLNIFSFVILALVIGLTIIIDKNFLMDSIIWTFAPNRLFLTFVLIILYLMLHEVLHSIGYYIYGAKYKNIVYGIELEKGIFYCLCKQNVNKKNIMNSLLFPLFYIGIVTYIIGFIFNSYYLLILSIFNLSGCVGDIFTFLFIRKLDKNIEFSEFDDTTSFGLYSDKDLSKGKYLGIKYVCNCEKIERNDYKKIKVSKISYIILFVMLVLSFITLFM
jgi:hypothetical protein